MNRDNPFHDLPALLTERLCLRKMKIEDNQPMFAYASHPEVSRFTTWETHQSIEDTNQFICLLLRQYEAGEPSNWGVTLRENEQLIGTCGFMYWDQVQRLAEIGYALAKDFWGRGLMVEAVRKIIEFAFERMAVERVIARCHIDNVASERVMQKVGMTFEKLLRQNIQINGEYVDVKQYAITKEKYEILKNHM
jgi:ribosomal-protein-alanine N-acetyltransferase